MSLSDRKSLALAIAILHCLDVPLLRFHPLLVLMLGSEDQPIVLKTLRGQQALGFHLTRSGFASDSNKICLCDLMLTEICSRHGAMHITSAWSVMNSRGGWIQTYIKSNHHNEPLEENAQRNI